MVCVTYGLVGLAHAQSGTGQQPRVRPSYGQSPGAKPTGGRIVDAQTRPPTAAPQGPPKEFQLTPSQEKRIDSMLDFWQQKTAGIQTLSAKFGRWVYDPVFGPKDRGQAAKFSTGEIRYAAVDKGLIREDAVYEYDAAKAKAGEKFPFQKTASMGEHWVCTGSAVFEYDHQAKKLNEIRLPAELQGKAIAEGPLPFMFGAKKETIKKRYWIREIPRKVDGAPFKLEFLPKLPGENYSLIQIELDSKKFLPTVMVLHELNKMGRSSYAFKEMQANSPSHKVGNFLNRFIAPRVPKGYELVVHEPPRVNEPPRGPESRSPERRATQPRAPERR